MNRLEFNREILKRLSIEIERFPDGRFNQILYNIGIVKMVPEFDNDGKPTGIMIPIDNHNEESKDTLKRIDNEDIG